MKYFNFLFVILLVTLWACDEDTPESTSIKGDSGITYDESFSRWENLKLKNGTSYVYSVTSESWTGYRSVTTLTVTDGTVSQRSYQAFSMNNPENEEVVYEEWTETGDSLGSHTAGVPLFTIDDLYETCVKDYLVVDESNNSLYFDTDASGVISLCGYTPDNCADDCYVGINIQAFSWVKDE
ncbi:hypothetical protein [Mangrovibacterium diazotrophicum]|uniref:Uncharacterized protein n=1 Tax=Mangrovibacterium diazotrophicum TaxID=1261403 RepID=A0A419VWE3_9BACT|nr:hypothetical protein [Mangrovibacterium diazotrophicum]RKD86470.1 hypothetical protein BC643_4163 [Mangrovibacterium diazotrophicum]